MKPRVNPLPKNKVTLFAPYLTADELAAVGRVIKNGWLTLGKETEKFEAALAHYTGAKYAVAANSGTAALHLAVIAAGIKPGDEVITTPFTFVASTNCILYEKAKPVFVDIDITTLNIDVGQIEAKITKKTRAILAVDVFGYPAEWRKIIKIARKYRLAVIEDAAEALGATYHGKKIGGGEHLAIFSFFPNKQITTGEGGAIVTNSYKQFTLMKSLANQGRITNQSSLNHHHLGYNYRMPELAAALGNQQLKKINWILANRRQIAGWYKQELSDTPGVKLIQPDDKNHHRSWFTYPILLRKNINRGVIAATLQRLGIPVKTYFTPIHWQPYLKSYGYRPGDFPVAEAMFEANLTLPFYTGMEQPTVNFICRRLKQTIAAA